jgi:hypothetical protein
MLSNFQNGKFWYRTMLFLLVDIKFLRLWVTLLKNGYLNFSKKKKIPPAKTSVLQRNLTWEKG